MDPVLTATYEILRPLSSILVCYQSHFSSHFPHFVFIVFSRAYMSLHFLWWWFIVHYSILSSGANPHRMSSVQIRFFSAAVSGFGCRICWLTDPHIFFFCLFWWRLSFSFTSLLLSDRLSLTPLLEVYDLGRYSRNETLT